MEFKPYIQNYIPRPIEAIGKMLERLDANNQRISEGYDKLKNSLYSLNIRPEDNQIIADTINAIDSEYKSLLESNDYSTIASGLNNIARKNLLENKALNASMLRSNQYSKYLEDIHALYLNGKIDKDQYNYAYTRPFEPTVPDEHGNYDSTYRNLYNPAFKVDLDKNLLQIASSLPVEQITKESTEYLTNAEVNQLLGGEFDIAEADLNKPSGIPKRSSIIATQIKTKDKIKKALIKYLTTDPDASNYVKDIANIKGLNFEDYVSSLVEPYLHYSQNNITTQTKDSTFEQQLALAKYRNQNRNNSSYTRKATERSNLIDKVQGALPFSVNVNLEDLNSNTSEFNLKLKQNNLNFLANTIYSKPYDKLNKQERQEVEKIQNSNILPSSSVYTGVGLSLKPEVSKDIATSLFGGQVIKRDSGSNSYNISGNVSSYGLYDVENGKYIPGSEINDYMVKKFNAKDLNINPTALYVHKDNPFANSLSNNNFTDPFIVQINGKTFIAPRVNNFDFDTGNESAIMSLNFNESMDRPFYSIPYNTTNNQYRVDVNKYNNIIQLDLYDNSGNPFNTVTIVKDDDRGYIANINGTNNYLTLDAFDSRSAIINLLNNLE